MNGATTRTGMSWSARLLVGLVLVLAGAGAAVWGLAHYQPAARFLGIAQPVPHPPPLPPHPLIAPAPQAPPPPTPAAIGQQLAQLQQRIGQLENATRQAQGSAGRADSLVVAFAARRAIDRGVALGYLEPLLVDRFGAQHQAAVATIVTDGRQPVRLNDLVAQYEELGPQLRRGGPQEGWWSNFRRELGSLIEIHRASGPPVSADARYDLALQRLSAGDVDQALAETMRLPGAADAADWVAKARRYIAVHRALDEIETAALLGGPNPTG